MLIQLRRYQSYLAARFPAAAPSLSPSQSSTVLFSPLRHTTYQRACILSRRELPPTFHLQGTRPHVSLQHGCLNHQPPNLGTQPSLQAQPGPRVTSTAPSSTALSPPCDGFVSSSRFSTTPVRRAAAAVAYPHPPLHRKPSLPPLAPFDPPFSSTVL